VDGSFVEANAAKESRIPRQQLAEAAQVNLLLVVSLVALSSAYAAPIRVDCNRGGSINATLATLASAGNTRGITIFVTGTCRENIFIYPFDHLKLQASPIATIQDASNGTLPTVEIFDSYDVTLIGFTINGGVQAVNCNTDSNCTLYLDRIQGAVDGVRFAGSHGRVLNSTVSNNSSRGIVVAPRCPQTEIRSAETAALV
jgi:hypothetical protein